MKPIRWALSLVLLAAFSVACDSDNPSSVGQRESLVPASSRALHPMSPGNFWAYERTFDFRYVTRDGPAPPDMSFTERVERRQTHFTDVAGMPYLVEDLSYLGERIAYRSWLRQDNGGLYERENVETIPLGLPGVGRADAIAASLPDGVSRRSLLDHLKRHDLIMSLATGGGPPRTERFEGEIVRLAYPIVVGRDWVVREEPLFGSVVEGLDRFAGIPAWRIRMMGSLIGDRDRVYMWFGRCGLLGWDFHLEGEATGPGGIPLGYFVSDETLTVTEMDLARGGCDTPGKQ